MASGEVRENGPVGISSKAGQFFYRIQVRFLCPASQFLKDAFFFSLTFAEKVYGNTAESEKFFKFAKIKKQVES